MSSELVELIEDLADYDAIRLMALVKEDLESGRVDDALAELSPEEANEFLLIVDRTGAAFPKIIERTACGQLSRSFLAELATLSPLDRVIANRLVDGGVKLNFSDFIGWATETLNLAALLGIQFLYDESETIEHSTTKTGKIKTHRTIRLSMGSKKR